MASFSRVLITFALGGCITLALFAQNTDEAAASAKKHEKATSGELYETIARMDAAVFDALNKRDLPRLMGMFTDDLEFYDDGDHGGPKNHAQVKEDFAKMFANVPDLRRELVPGTLEVYPLPDYGAIEVGTHRFCHEESGKRDCGTMKFSMVWRKVGDSWKLSRVLSYAH
jgi:ketosteroid isomerase-like protein